MTLAYQPLEVLGMVDSEKGLIDRRIFSDQGIYEMELEQVFARAWNFMCHDSQIPNPGDFFMSLSARTGLSVSAIMMATLRF